MLVTSLRTLSSGELGRRRTGERADAWGGGRNIVLSLLSTYGLYLIASIIFFDVSHNPSLSRGGTDECGIAIAHVHLIPPIPPRSSLLPALLPPTDAEVIQIAPSYINVINVYAFCNVQDVTWGSVSLPSLLSSH